MHGREVSPQEPLRKHALGLTVHEANSNCDHVIAVFERRHEVAVDDATIKMESACFTADGSMQRVGFAATDSPLVELGGVTAGEVSLLRACADLVVESCPVCLMASRGGTGS